MKYLYVLHMSREVNDMDSHDRRYCNDRNIPKCENSITQGLCIAIALVTDDEKVVLELSGTTAC